MLLISLIAENSFGEVPAPILSGVPADKVILIEKGTEAPFKGYLFPEDKALKFRKDLIELDGLRELEKSYQKSLDLSISNEAKYNSKVNILLEQNDKLATALYSSKDRNSWENAGWFVLGILVTGTAFYGASRLRP